MTDNEIIKVLDKCLSNGDCTDECPCVRSNIPCAYNEKNILRLIELINHQKEEIERLKRSLDNMTDALIRTDDYCRDLECKKW